MFNKKKKKNCAKQVSTIYKGSDFHNQNLSRLTQRNYIQQKEKNTYEQVLDLGQ